MLYKIIRQKLAKWDTAHIMIFLLVSSVILRENPISIQTPVANLSLSRIFIILFFGIGFLKGTNFSHRTPLSRLFYTVSYIWIIVGVLHIALLSLNPDFSRLWAVDITPGILELVGITWGILYVIITLGITKSRLELILFQFRVLGGMVFLTLVIGLVEISTGFHLPSTYLREVAEPAGVSNYVAATFGNPNAYATLLVSALPILLYGYYRTLDPKRRLRQGLFIALLMFILFMTTSRLGIITAFFEIILFFVLIRVRKLNLRLLSIFVGLVVVLLIGVLVLAASNQIPALQAISVSEGSFMFRVNLILNSFHFFSLSNGLGIGPGMYEQYLEAGFGAYDIRLVTSPHNFWGELFAQYGLVVGITWIYFYLFLFYRLFQIYRVQQLKLLAITGIVTLLGNLIIVNVNSSALNFLVQWLILAILLQIINYGYHTIQSYPQQEQKD